MAKSLKFIPLGGATEIGRNNYVYEVEDQIILVDCGIMFPEDGHLGVDLLLPDITYLRENADRFLGIVITHGHEDHIGALPYVLRELPVPIWATRLTLGLIRKRLHEHGLWQETDWHLVEDGDRVEIGPFNVEYVHVNHSVPDACSLVIRTSAGNVVHTSDFKFDQTPVDGLPSDLGALARAGDEGVLALVTDSTNVDKPGYVASERMVGEHFDQFFMTAKGRVVVASFASNLSRVQQAMDTSVRYGRKIALAGRSMLANVDVARELGYLHVEDDSLIRLNDLADYDPAEVTIICTGSQGEPMAALSRMAMGDHRQIEIQPGDTVIVSSTPIPGNEDLVWRTINHLYRRGANVIHTQHSPGIHVSGHGNREELKMMVNLTRPDVVVPVHGEYRHLVLWQELAESMGYKCQPLENGNVLEISKKGAEIVGSVPSGVVILDGTGSTDLDDAVLRDRRHLSEDGIVLIVLSLNRDTGELLADPEVISRGAMLQDETEELEAEIIRSVVEFLDGLNGDGAPDWDTLRTETRQLVNRMLRKKTGRRPMVVPVIMEV